MSMNGAPGTPPPTTAESERPSPLARLVAEHRRNRLVRKLARISRRYLDWYENLSYDMQTNGEGYVLRTLSRFEPRILFDVGANVGEWSGLASTLCPDAEIHAFEISGPTFARLTANLGGRPRIRLTNAGLSDSEGSISIRHYADMPALTTSSDYPHPFKYTEVSARVVTGDSYAGEQRIDHIDMLKIDVEGMEAKVLQGFEKMLSSGAIRLVQFEYGRVSIMNHFLLRDFYTLFEGFGYSVGKIFPNHVDFRAYDLVDEDFIGPNYLACASGETDLLRALENRR